MVFKGNTGELLVRQLRDLWKDQARIHRIYQKTKPENYEHWRRRKGTSKRNS
jgi:hypothetical protein